MDKPWYGRSAGNAVACVWTVLLAAVVGLALATGAGNCQAQSRASLQLKGAQEIAPFRLTGIDGYVETRYLSDDNISSAAAGGAGSHTKQSNMIGEVFLMTHSYIYHPSLLLLDLGGGPTFDKGSYDGDGVTANSNRQMFNLSGRATILRDKPYTGAVFYDRRNGIQSMGPAQAMITQNTLYGANFLLLKPVTQIPLQMDLIRTENQGNGAGQIIEDRTDQIRLRLEASLGQLGSSRFNFEGTRQDSVSGSSGLPIQASSSTNDRLNLDTLLKFGAMNEYDLNNVVTYNTNRYHIGHNLPAELQDFGFGLDLRGQHSADLQTYGRYNFNTSKQGDQDMTMNSAGAGVSYHLTPDLSGNLGARGEDNKSSQINSTSYGLDGSAQYRQTLPLGQATASYSFAYNQHDQQAAALQASVIGEHVTLNGTTLTTLVKEQIIAGSVIVSNLTRTQSFVEGVDYVLFPLGLRLRIQRVIGGNILDGEEVLVDYSYATGGSYAASQRDNTVGLNWTLKSYLEAYLRYTDSAPHLISGTPTSPFNPAYSTFYGVRTDFPLSLLAQEFLLGGHAEHEDRREIVAPYQRADYEAYAQTDLPWFRRGNVRAGTRRTQVDYDLSPAQGVRLVAYDLRLGARTENGIDLSAEATHERDTGGPQTRERTFASAKARWRMRKLQATFDLTRVRETQGVTGRTRTYGQLVLRRDF